MTERVNRRVCVICGQHIKADLAVEVEFFEWPNFRKVVICRHAHCRPSLQPEQ